MKKVVSVVLVSVFLVTISGCRIPIVDPPIIGRWLANNSYYEEYFIFNRDKTGKVELVFDDTDYKSDASVSLLSLLLEHVGDEVFLKQTTQSVSFSWTYDRTRHILTIRIFGEYVELQVEYNNLLRTQITMYPPNRPRDRVNFTLVSTPILRCS